MAAATTWFSAAAVACGGAYLARLIGRSAGLGARRFYEGGFEKVMTRREAARILGVRERAELEKIKDAYKRVMLANHPDAGGSPFMASKINEAKDLLLNRARASDSAF